MELFFNKFTEKQMLSEIRRHIVCIVIIIMITFHILIS